MRESLEFPDPRELPRFCLLFFYFHYCSDQTPIPTINILRKRPRLLWPPTRSTDRLLDEDGKHDVDDDHGDDGPDREDTDGASRVRRKQTSHQRPLRFFGEKEPSFQKADTNFHYINSALLVGTMPQFSNGKYLTIHLRPTATTSPLRLQYR